VFPDWVHGDTPRGAIRTLVTVDDRDRYRGTGVERRTEPFCTGVRWTARGGTRHHTIAPDDLDGASQQAAARGPWSDAPLGWFLAAYGAHRRLGTPSDVARLTGDPVASRVRTLFNDGATLTEAVDWLKRVHHRAQEQEEGAADLRDAVLDVLRDGLLPEDVSHVDSDGLWVTRGHHGLPLEHVGDGYGTVAALVVDLLGNLHRTYGTLELTRHPEQGHVVCPLPGVVLIDEVDAHMHVAWQQRIGFWLTSRFPRLQFLVTTHSPFICQAARPGGLFRLPAPGEDRAIEQLPDDVWSAVVNGGADDAVMTELFGLEHAHSPQSERLRREVAALEGRVLRGEASAEQTARYVELRDSLSADIGALADQKLRAILGSRR
jgi:AAA domain, putative AbiEii toxin, Type IV TA system